jgi:hypothetical protein
LNARALPAGTLFGGLVKRERRDFRLPVQQKLWCESATQSSGNIVRHLRQLKNNLNSIAETGLRTDFFALLADGLRANLWL